jgi:hypothetical protein
MFSSQNSQAASGDTTYIEDVFSTYLYTGNGTSQIIENGINLGVSNSGGSVYFDGSGDSLVTPTSANLNIGTGAFQIDFWMYSLAVPSQFVGPFGTNNGGGSGGIFFAYRSGNLDFVNNYDTAGVISAAYPAINQWHHIALVRNSSNVRSYYINGTRVGTLSNSVDFNQTQITVGNTSWNGYVSNFRVIVGSNIDNPNSSTITVPTAPTTAVSGTQLLLCQTPTPLVDKSTNAFAITVNGNAKASEVGPFTSAIAGKGGLVWVKGRNETFYHRLASSPGPTLPNYLSSNSTDAQGTLNGTITAFNASGFTVSASAGGTNSSSVNYASWTFRRQPKFFDVVTLNNSTTTYNHNLGSTPGCIIVKCTDASGANWVVWHRSFSNTTTNYLRLNTTSAVQSFSDAWPSAPTSTQFSVNPNLWANGTTGIAYLFAHNAGGFGLTGADNVISCGIAGIGGGAGTVDLGFEPQWIMAKDVSDGFNWNIVDNMRGNGVQSENYLRANSTNAEGNSGTTYFLKPNATGFSFPSSYSTAGGFIYIAIRRGPMRVPTSGTSVYGANVWTGGSTTFNAFPPDLATRFTRSTDYGGWKAWGDRLRGEAFLNSINTNAEEIDNIITFNNAAGGSVVSFGATTPLVSYFMRRARSFFDVVCYTGTGSARTVTHNLGVVPELMIVKCRSNIGAWTVYNASIGNGFEVYLNLTNAAGGTDSWNNTTPTSTVFSLTGGGFGVNDSARTYVAYLFATCAGVSKVGSYTGTGSSLTINCGFTSGARFVLIKCTTQAYDWMVFDTSRGINAATDPFLVLNSSVAENTISTGQTYDLDWIDPNSTGFTLPNNYGYVNASGETYIFLAIA